jgi:hypothetical protein
MYVCMYVCMYASMFELTEDLVILSVSQTTLTLKHPRRIFPQDMPYF